MTKDELFQAIKEDENLSFTKDFLEAIYVIKGCYVSGNFDRYGRTVDHADLLQGDCTWEELLHYGTILVPEEQTAIGTKCKETCKRYGYKMMPVHKNNHIMGWS